MKTERHPQVGILLEIYTDGRLKIPQTYFKERKKYELYVSSKKEEQRKIKRKENIQRVEE